MASKRLYASGPPLWEPGPSRSFYLPEDYYFVDADAAALHFAARMTARCVARWSDSYAARTLALPTHYREGLLPDDPAARESSIDEVVDWLERLVPLYLAGLSLSQGDQLLLEQSDGIPGILALTYEEFAELQKYWEHHGIPKDLYYPAEAQQTIIEPVEIYGGVARLLQRYSPRRWARRDHEEIVTRQVPSEEQSRVLFAEACSRFIEAVMLRIAHLSQPEQELDMADEMIKLEELARAVSSAMRRAQSDRTQPPDQSSE